MAPPPPGPYSAPPQGYPVTGQPAVMNEEDSEKKRRKRKVVVPDFIKEMPEYQSAQSQQTAGIVTLGVGGGALLGGAFWLIWASLRGCGFFQSCTPDRGGQLGGALLMGGGGIAMGVGGAVFGTARSEKRKILQKYMPSPDEMSLQVGPGSVSFAFVF